MPTGGKEVNTMPTEVTQELLLADVERALSEGLGSGYRVKATSDSTLRVSRNPVIWAVVRVSWTGGRTIFSVRPGGALLVLALNAAYTVPKVRHVLDRAFAG
jgi:hypothetical protein